MCLTALDGAVEFQQHFVVPGNWKTEVKEESSSSEDEDDDEEEEQEEDGSGEEEEVALTLHPSHLQNRGKKVQNLKVSRLLSTGGGGAVPRGAGELSAAALQVHGRQR